MKLGYIGLGKMGYNMCLRLDERGYDVVVYNRSPEKTEKLLTETHAVGVLSLEELVENLNSPRLIWIMVTNDAVDEIVNKLKGLLNAGDTVIEAGDSFYKETQRRARELEEMNINYIDVGVGGGPKGARNGSSLMIGGKIEDFQASERLFKDLAVENGYEYLGNHGAGHFVKMVHNGIEYGMMQAIAEGFSILKSSEFELSLEKVMKPYRHGSVIESRLLDWLNEAFEKYGDGLDPIKKIADHSNAGTWTVQVAKDMGISDDVIHTALEARIASKKNPNYQAQIISAMRGEFGGHQVKVEEE